MRTLVRTNTPNASQILGLQLVNKLKELVVDIEIKKEIIAKHIKKVDAFCNKEDSTFQVDEIRDFCIQLLDVQHAGSTILKKIYHLQNALSYEGNETLQLLYTALAKKVQKFELSFFEVETDAKHFNAVNTIPEIDFRLDSGIITKIAI